MQHSEDPHVLGRDLEDDPIVTDPEFPVAPERATEWHAEARRVCAEPCLDRSANSPTGLGGNLREVIGTHCGVIAKGERHSAFLDATPPPYLVVRQPC